MHVSRSNLSSAAIKSNKEMCHNDTDTRLAALFEKGGMLCYIPKALVTMLLNKMQT